MTRLMVAHESEVESIFALEVFTLMRDGFLVQYVTGLVLDIERVQCWISSTKMRLLLEHFENGAVRDLIGTALNLSVNLDNKRQIHLSTSSSID